jgi:predicted nucleotidyltransferase
VEKDQIVKEILGIIRHHLPGEEFKVLLFGSWAKNLAEPTSDIDIGILGPHAIDSLLLLRLQEEIRAIPTLRRIDVVDLCETDESFRNEVLSYAKEL